MTHIEGFNEIIDFLTSHSTLAHNVTITDDHVQYVKDSVTVVIGLNSLRLLFVDNDKFASITMVPTDVQAGSLVIPREMKLALYNTDFRKDVSSLYISGAETFQLSTVYDFDFGILKDIVPKYLEVLEVLKIAPKTDKKVHVPTLEAAIESVREAAKQYEEE